MERSYAKVDDKLEVSMVVESKQTFTLEQLQDIKKNTENAAEVAKAGLKKAEESLVIVEELLKSAGELGVKLAPVDAPDTI